MKKILVVMLIALAAFGMISCGGEKVSGLPDFVLNPPKADDAFYGVGYGKQSTFAMSKTIAQQNATDDIAKQIQTSIQSSVVSYAQEAGVDGDTQTITFAETIAKQITDTTLSGVTPERFEQDDDGGIWVLMSCPKASMLDVAEEAFERNEDAAFAEFKAGQALERLNAELEENPPQADPYANK